MGRSTWERRAENETKQKKLKTLLEQAKFSDIVRSGSGSRSGSGYNPRQGALGKKSGKSLLNASFCELLKSNPLVGELTLLSGNKGDTPGIMMMMITITIITIIIIIHTIIISIVTMMNKVKYCLQLTGSQGQSAEITTSGFTAASKI